MHRSRPSSLPEGEAKVLVEGLCTMCHQTNMITASMGYTRDGWKELTGTMLDLSGNPDMRDKLIDYLATNFPPNTRRAPTLVSGPVQITLKEWVMPQLGQRSRDPIQAEDGSIWYAGQFGNLMGNINPATGAIKEYELPANAKPHTVELDAKGNVWYTGNSNGSLGYLDPKTGKITVFKMPTQGKGPAHAGLRQEWDRLVHAAEQQHAGAYRSRERRYQARHPQRTGLQALRHQDRLGGQSLVLLQRASLPVQGRCGHHDADQSDAPA
jgi:virginiamycin B lyase